MTSISQSYQTGIESWVNEVDAKEFIYKVNIYPENLLEFTVSRIEIDDVNTSIICGKICES